jgi:hypothetical protein
MCLLCALLLSRFTAVAGLQLQDGLAGDIAAS